MQIEGVAYHHTGDNSPDPQFAKVDAYHKSKGFPISKLGFYTGYTYFIGRDGTLKQARSEDERGAHTVNCGCSHDKSGLPYDTANERYIAICFAGNLAIDPPTKAQLATALALTEDLQKRRGIPNGKLLNHWDFKATACPGYDIAKEILRLKDFKEQIAVAERSLSRVIPERRSKILRFIQTLTSYLP